MARGKKYTYQEVYDYFRLYGCELLSKNYNNKKELLEYQCSCGSISNKSFQNFKKNYKCNNCAFRKTYDFEYVNNYFKEHNCILLSDKYINSIEKLDYICSCGHKSKIGFNEFLRGQRCKNCKGIKLREKFKKDYKEVKKIFEDNGCVLLSNEYNNIKQKLDYICSCGNKDKISLDCFMKGHRCKKCGNKKIGESKKISYSFIKNYFEKCNCKLLTKEYYDNHQKLEYICSCGNKSSITFAHFQNGHRCMKCAGNNRSGEKNHNFNPNISDEERILKRHTQEYNHWRKEVYKKDNYTCQVCSSKNIKGKKIKIHAHHLFGFNDKIELRYNIFNGITLCSHCHYEFHILYGKKNNTPTQFFEFKNNKYFLLKIAS